MNGAAHLCGGLCSDVGCSLNEGARCDLSSKMSGPDGLIEQVDLAPDIVSKDSHRRAWIWYNTQSKEQNQR